MFFPSRTGCRLGILCLFLVFPGYSAALDAPCQGQGPDLVVETNTANTTESPNLTRVLDFIKAGTYLEWQHDPYIRPTGTVYQTPTGDQIDGTTHHRVRIYYSEHVAQWVNAGRPTLEEWQEMGSDPACYLPDGATIVKEMYKSVPPIYPEEDPVIGWAVMVRKNGASHDGWFWVIYFREEFRSMATMGTFTYSFCLTCHASSKSQTTFASPVNLSGADSFNNEGRATMPMVEQLFFTNLGSPQPIASHRTFIDPNFRRLYSDPAIYPYSKPPEYHPEQTGPTFPSSDFDHTWNRVNPPDRSYLTSDNCIGCHDATSLVGDQVPNMMIRNPVKNDQTGTSYNELLNLSVYGEWRASPMGMAGRDPIFYAQLESEMNSYPQDSATIQNTCLSCHGAMGQRQYMADTNQQFSLDMVFHTEGKNAKYSALARDGISCMVCHQMDPETVNHFTNTGKFRRGKWDEIYASTAADMDPGGPIRTWPMEHALGFTPKYNAYVNKSEMCGVCHTIVLPVDKPEEPYQGNDPVLDNGTVMMSRAHEQNTFSEWFYSSYQNSNPDLPINEAQARTCQDCHMDPTFQGNGHKVNFKVANVENTSWPEPPARELAPAYDISVPNRPTVGRHTLFGMNLFVLTFYNQFSQSIFGIEPDTNPPMGTTDSFQFAIDNGNWQVENSTAAIEFLKVAREGDDLVARVRVTNKAGHRLPSGVGFRRAWLELRVLDQQGNTLWGSGVTDENGVMVNADGKTPLVSEFTVDKNQLQPHWEEITAQDQAQIYEERYENRFGDEVRLNTSFLGIGKVVKDNRLQPQGYHFQYILNRLEDAKTSRGREKWQSLLPEYDLPPRKGALDPAEDPQYKSGSGTDEVSYRIPLSQVKKGFRISASLNYQNIPPYYLRDRFAVGAGGQQTQRLYYLVGHTKVQETPIENWKIQVVETSAPFPANN